MVFDFEALCRSAVLGFTPALAHCAANAQWMGADARRFEWAERAAAQGDRSGKYELGRCWDGGHGCTADGNKARALMVEAAELGCVPAMNWLAQRAPTVREQLRSWRAAAARGCTHGLMKLRGTAAEHLQRLDNGEASAARVVFEVGAACSGYDAAGGRGSLEAIGVAALLRCRRLYEGWCADAKGAIAFWIGVGRRINVAKDIRLLIARLLWEQRAEWSRVK